MSSLVKPPDRRRTPVLIVCDTRLYRDGLAANLSRYPHINVVGAVEPSPATRTQIAQCSPAVVIVDTGTVGSLDLVRELNHELADRKIIAIAGTTDGQQLMAFA